MKIKKVSFAHRRPGTVFNAETGRWIGYQGQKMINGKKVVAGVFENLTDAALFMNELRGPAPELSPRMQQLRDDFKELCSGEIDQTEFDRRRRPPL